VYVLVLWLPVTRAAASEPAVRDLAPEGWLVLPAVDDRGRRPFRPDAVFARYLLDAASPPPCEGESLTGETGEEATWEWREAGGGGSPGGGIAWAWATLESPTEQVLLADLQGASTLFVNGMGFVGDVYRFGFRGVPVALKKGENTVVVTGIRGAFRFAFHEPEGEALLAGWDRTLPDLVPGEDDIGPLGLLVVNATNQPAALRLDVAADPVFEPARQALRVLQPLEVAKVAVPQVVRPGASPPEGVGSLVRPATLRRGEQVADRARIDLRIVEAHAPRRRTILSRIDGTTQFYGVLRPSEGGDEEFAETSLVLSLHGAGVDALGQVASYSAKPDFWHVAPTNRRPFGFDWQDWGRMDAYDVL
jgi:hypothetical protein